MGRPGSRRCDELLGPSPSEIFPETEAAEVATGGRRGEDTLKEQKGGSAISCGVIIHVCLRR